MDYENREQREALERAVDEFADAMKERLLEKREQGYTGWDDPEVAAELHGRIWNATGGILERRRREIRENELIHDRKEIDLANLAMFLWHHRERK